jgi:hypothetical protein
MHKKHSVALNLNFGENDGPTTSDGAAETGPPSGCTAGGAGSLESPFRIRNKQKQLRMQKVLGTTLVSDERLLTGATNSKRDDEEREKAPEHNAKALPEASKYKLKPVLSERRAKRLSSPADQDGPPESTG